MVRVRRCHDSVSTTDLTRGIRCQAPLFGLDCTKSKESRTGGVTQRWGSKTRSMECPPI